MPVRVPNDLPARAELAEENIFVMSDDRAAHQDIRPLRIAVVNLMPTKLVTETQLLRLLGNTSLQVNISFVRMGSHESKNTPIEHLEAFYEPLESVLGERFDGLLITGRTGGDDALRGSRLLARAQRTHGVVPEKRVVHPPHLLGRPGRTLLPLWHQEVPAPGEDVRALPSSGPRLEGPPVARLRRGILGATLTAYRGRRKEIETEPALKLLSTSEEAGVYIAASRDGREVYVTGHPEYDRLSLKAEYDRDVAKGLPIKVPANYFPGDDPRIPPLMTWRSHAHLLYANWLNYYVYQATPYDLGKLPTTDTPFSG